MREKSKSTEMREILTTPGVAAGVGAGDSLCAKLIEQAGFDFVWSSSLCVSASFAIPDAKVVIQVLEERIYVNSNQS